MDDYLYWVWLSQLRGIGHVTGKKLIKFFHSPQAVYQAKRDELLAVPGVGEKMAGIILHNRSLQAAEKILVRMLKEQIELLTINHPLYPEPVRQLADSPLLLYYRGQLEKNSMGVGIVGARRCTAYGMRVTQEAAQYLAANRIPVISGMAKGIDGYAHTGCLKAQGRTYAFLGHGVDMCYPPEHQELMAAIIANGAVISEYPPGTAAKQAHFPRRNFLLSAWSQKLLVVEAGRNSGALITAGEAKQQGKAVFAVPGGIYSRESQGTNRLIAEGAQVYLAPVQLIVDREERTDGIVTKNAEFSRCKAEKGIDITACTPLEKEILSVLNSAPVSVDELMSLVPQEKKSVLETLSLMELEGKVQRLPGGLLSR